MDGEGRPGGGEGGAPGTRGGDVAVRVEGFVLGVEDLVFVRVEVEVAGGGGVEVGGEGGPFRGGDEGVVHDDVEVRVAGRGRGGFDLAVGVSGELLGGGELVGAPGDGLVDEFEAGDDVGVGGGAVFGGHLGEDGDGLLEVVGGLPFYRAGLTGVVETVLGPWTAVEVDPDFEVVVASPTDGLVEVGSCACLVGCSAVVVSPEANGNADGIEAE